MPGAGPLGRFGGGPVTAAAGRDDGGLCSLASQVSSTGGGTGVDTVVALMSPMMTRASFSA